MEEFAGFIGKLGPTVGLWVLVAMFAVYLIREWRETRKLSADDRLARRNGYLQQVQFLTGENRSLRNDLRLLEKRHDAYREQCQTETASLQQQILDLQRELASLRSRLAGDERTLDNLRKVSR